AELVGHGHAELVPDVAEHHLRAELDGEARLLGTLPTGRADDQRDGPGEIDHSFPLHRCSADSSRSRERRTVRTMTEQRTERVVQLNRGVERAESQAPERGPEHNALQPWLRVGSSSCTPPTGASGSPAGAASRSSATTRRAAGTPRTSSTVGET